MSASRLEERDAIELRMDARPENLALARLALAGVAARAGVPSEIVADLKLAVTEACANAMQHAYPDTDGSDEVVVRYALADSTLAVEVLDSGIGFEPERAMLRDERRESDHRGMGLMIMGIITDELTIASSETGSRIAFSRNFSREG